MTKTNQTLDQINARKQQLAANDQRYFDDLQLYLSTAGLFYDEAKLNDQLLSMLLDLQDANADGQSAIEFFGNDPQTMGNAIIQEFPTPKLRDQLGLLGSIIGITWLFQLLYSRNNAAGMHLNIIAFIVVPLIETLAIMLILRVLHHSVYTVNAKNWLPYVQTAVIISVTIGLMLLFTTLAPLGWTVLIPSPWNNLLLTVIAILATGYLVFVLSRHRHHKKL